MDALILAAGTGSRLVNLTRELPKALVQVAGRPLVDYTLDFVHTLGCDKIVVVGGFYFDKLQAHLSGKKNIRLLENKDFLKGSILTLAKGLPEMNDSFILMNVDHIYPKRLARTFAASQAKLTEISAFVDFDRPLQEDDMKVQLADGKTIGRISKGLHEFDAGYIGMTYVPARRLEIYREAALQLAQENECAVVENLLQRLIEQGNPPEIFPVSGTRWLEVDNQWDLQNAKRILKWVEDFLD
ncbi:MAG: hypothetical protein D6743_12245 [Calditrichaeota bacterium]|nr:MAG: hypothetical protein D6743_12245 [Calditrichota bacterium]